MTDERVIVVTGVASYWGNRVATRLLEQDDVHVIGIDDEPPQENVDGLDFIQADLRNPLLVELLQQEQAETVIHLKFRETLTPSESGFEQNVMGTAKLLGACGEAGVARVILKSSTMVYGARPDNPMFLREDHPLNGNKKYGYVRDWVEIEKYADSFHEQNPGTMLTVLRFGHIVGPKADTPMTRFLREEEAITLLGFDPMVQVIHEDDVVSALAHAANGDSRGVFNVAPEKGMPLWKTLGLATKLPIPILHPFAYWSVSLGGPRLAPLPLDYLRFPCMGDMAKMRDVLQFTPQFTPEETVREFSAQQRVRKLLGKKSRESFEQDRLRDTLQRRKRLRERDHARGATRKKKAA
ncbi:MAG: NAD-dependent epimerase/dehydratase family protein, partial [Anaerolineales bacterium]|nr:NAD-dependent epimerase/dehydratase family protein [Anaerolineales bacterium]